MIISYFDTLRSWCYTYKNNLNDYNLIKTFTENYNISKTFIKEKCNYDLKDIKEEASNERGSSNRSSGVH